jgi:hypothetical protein
MIHRSQEKDIIIAPREEIKYKKAREIMRFGELMETVLTLVFQKSFHMQHKKSYRQDV